MQQVNLYTTEFRRSEQPFSFRQILIYASVFFVGLICVSVFFQWRSHSVLQQVQLAEADLLKVEAEVEALKAQRPQSQRESLQRDLEKLSARLDQMQHLQKIMDGRALGNNQGFSQHLTALAKQSNTQLSLNTFSLSEGGKSLQMSGEAVVAAAVPEYLHKLREEVSFRDTRYGVLNIENGQRDGSGLKFSLVKLLEDVQ